ncbi:hypothetical protein L873DRAFT_1822600, partial [Choiromyces venosus 120613-1]
MFKYICRPAFKLTSTYLHCSKVHYLCKVISTSSVHNGNHNTNHNVGHCHNSNIGGIGSKLHSASFTTSKAFSKQPKDDANMNLKHNHLESGQNEKQGKEKDDLENFAKIMERQFELMDAERAKKSGKQNDEIDDILDSIYTVAYSEADSDS